MAANFLCAGGMGGCMRKLLLTAAVMFACQGT